jgi:hypothetical protein
MLQAGLGYRCFAVWRSAGVFLSLSACEEARLFGVAFVPSGSSTRAVKGRGKKRI